MMTQSRYMPGQRVRVTQQTPRQERPGAGPLSTTIEATIVGFEQQKTGSWYAHAKDHKLWLDRLVVRKDDGEVVYVNLDRYSAIEILPGAGAAS